MFKSLRRNTSLKAELAAALQDRDWFAEVANELWEEAAELREHNAQWRDLYEFTMAQINDLYAENERLRSANYELMGYELADDDADVPF